MVDYKDSCVCGKPEDNNCAHYLTNWMILNGNMSANPPGCYCCSSGRPIRAKEVRDYIFKPKFTEHTTYPGSYCYVYCENRNNGRGHVYYGSKSHCAAGTKSADQIGYDYNIHYYN
uniref:Uncharacterized protein n=1 Tax=Acrobeloides nanus TaxID=290746 RepID=A0A914EP22_9BILA